MHRLTTAQLAEYLNVTKRSIQRRAKKECWSYIETNGLGGIRSEFHFEALPLNVKSRVIASVIAKHQALNLEITYKTISKKQQLKADPYLTSTKTATKTINSWVEKHIFASLGGDTQLCNFELNKDYIEQGIISLARLYIAAHNLKKVQGYDSFCQLYNQQQIAISQQVYTVVKSISRITLIRWEKKTQIPKDIKNQAIYALDDSLMSLIREFVNVVPNITIEKLRAYFTIIATNKKHLPGERSIRLILTQLKAETS